MVQPRRGRKGGQRSLRRWSRRLERRKPNLWIDYLNCYAQRQSALAETLALGWRQLGEIPGRQIIMGAVTQPWQQQVEFRGLPAEEFAAFREPGYAKILWTLEAESISPAQSLFRTETRVATTDQFSREKFRRYWSFLSPGIILIRYETLRLVRAEAEQRAKE